MFGNWAQCNKVCGIILWNFFQEYRKIYFHTYLIKFSIHSNFCFGTNIVETYFQTVKQNFWIQTLKLILISVLSSVKQKLYLITVTFSILKSWIAKEKLFSQTQFLYGKKLFRLRKFRCNVTAAVTKDWRLSPNNW